MIQTLICIGLGVWVYYNRKEIKQWGARSGSKTATGMGRMVQGFVDNLVWWGTFGRVDYFDAGWRVNTSPSYTIGQMFAILLLIAVAVVFIIA